MIVVIWKPIPSVREVSGQTERGESALQVNIRWLNHLTRCFLVLSYLPGHNSEIQAKLLTAISKSIIDAGVFCVRLNGQYCTFEEVKS